MSQGLNKNQILKIVSSTTPEILNSQYNKESDIFQAGGVMYQMLFGIPFDKYPYFTISKLLHAKLNFPPNPVNNISIESKEMIKKMFFYDPYTRSNAKDL